MKHAELIDTYLGDQHMMQLATVKEEQPWCCTVYYVHDNAEVPNIYWASLPTRRHSQEIVNHSRVAAAIAIRFTKGKKVTGIQIAGTAEELEPSPDNQPAVELYAAKFNRDAQWVDDITTGQTEHHFYRLTPKSIVLFDEATFPNNPRQELL